MLPFDFMQKWGPDKILADLLPPHALTGGLLLVSALIILVFGIWRRKKDFLAWCPWVVFALAGSALFLPASLPVLSSIKFRFYLKVMAALFLFLGLVTERFKQSEMQNGKGGSDRAALIYSGLMLLLLAFSLFYNLGGYAGSLLTWESTVVQSYGQAYRDGEGLLKFTLERFLWDEGLLSRGQLSLLYGAPTWWVFHLVGFSPWTLRFAAVILGLLCLPAIHYLGRRFFGPVVGSAAAALLALNINMLYYGRYGSSSTGTILSVLIAMYCIWLFLESEKPAWWMGLAVAGSVYLATLHYAPARLVMLVYCGIIVIACAVEWRKFWWRRALVIVIIILCFAEIWHIQKRNNHAWAFLEARGEQYMNFLRQPSYIQEYLGRPVAPHQLTLLDKITILYKVLEVTIPQYKTSMSPDTAIDTGRRGAYWLGDPPALRLYYGPFVILILLGVFYSLYRWRDWKHVSLLAWVILCSVPLLLTNRVDAHRILLFVIPLTIWAAFGAWEAARCMAYAKVPVVLRHVLAGLLILSVVYANSNTMHGGAGEPRQARILINEINLIPGPVAVDTAIDHREASLVNLYLMDRTRRRSERRGFMLDEATHNNILDGNIIGNQVAEYYLNNLRTHLETGRLVFAPAERFRGVSEALKQQGYDVQTRGKPELQILVIRRSDLPDSPNVMAEDLDIEPIPTETPAPFQAGLRQGPLVYLSEIAPVSLSTGFAEPRFNTDWQGNVIRMGGVAFAHGIGAHAWCRLVYDVPGDASAFQAIIGLSDEAQNCNAPNSPASVIFEVRDGRNNLLFESGVMVPATQPLPVLVNIQDATAIVLMITEGGNGRDCDHANWAEAAFLLKPPFPTPAAAETLNATAAGAEIPNVTAAGAIAPSATNP